MGFSVFSTARFTTCRGSRRITSHSKRKAPGMARPLGEFPGGAHGEKKMLLPSPYKETATKLKKIA